jgi:hypothetical protein
MRAVLSMQKVKRRKRTLLWKTGDRIIGCGFGNAKVHQIVRGRRDPAVLSALYAAIRLEQRGLDVSISVCPSSTPRPTSSHTAWGICPTRHRGCRRRRDRRDRRDVVVVVVVNDEICPLIVVDTHRADLHGAVRIRRAVIDAVVVLVRAELDPVVVRPPRRPYATNVRPHVESSVAFSHRQRDDGDDNDNDDDDDADDRRSHDGPLPIVVRIQSRTGIPIVSRARPSGTVVRRDRSTTRSSAISGTTTNDDHSRVGARRSPAFSTVRRIRPDERRTTNDERRTTTVPTPRNNARPPRGGGGGCGRRK